MGPNSTKHETKDSGAGSLGEDLAMAGGFPRSQDVPTTRIEGAAEQTGSGTPSQRTALQTVGDLFGWTTSDQVEELKTKNWRLKTENHELVVRNHDLWADNQALKSQIERYIKVLESKEREYNIKLDEKRAQLEQKDVELAEMKKTLCMYDDCSESDITNMVEAINTKIQSFCRNVSGRLIKDASKPAEGSVDQKHASEEEAANLTRVIGIPLVNALNNSTPGKTKYAALFLQVAWRACIVATVTKILFSFSAPLTSTAEGQRIDMVLRSISGKVMNGEAQPAYGRWRHITHRYLQQVFPDEEQAIQVYGNEALGYCRTAGRLVMKNRCPDDYAFAATFDPKLKEIMADAVKILTVFQEKRITTNFEPFIPEKGARFSAENMEIGKQDKLFDNDRVVCITGLGLLYWGKRGRENTSGMPTKYIFKKVEVFTENNFNEMVAGI
ncbi:hypothetical protein FS837_009946 [Tulasnella sp. UAMH 9824]|nr:hypothetical protein FS837_009946 [Tulasnella sp. UAMH 9824]